MSYLSNASTLRRTVHFALLIGLLIASTLINLFQARKISRLENTVVALKSEGKLAIGSSVPRIDASDPNGHSVSLSYGANEPPTVLYVFSPQCKWCERNLGSVKELAKAVSGKYRFATITLSEDNLQQYIATKDFQFPVYARLSVDTLRAYKLGGTPQTLVISNDGRVQGNWMGAFTGDTRTELETFFKIKLPDLPKS
jgi:peroxiredoxin